MVIPEEVFIIIGSGSFHSAWHSMDVGEILPQFTYFMEPIKIILVLLKSERNTCTYVHGPFYPF